MADEQPAQRIEGKADLIPSLLFSWAKSRDQYIQQAPELGAFLLLADLDPVLTEKRKDELKALIESHTNSKERDVTLIKSRKLLAEVMKELGIGLKIEEISLYEFVRMAAERKREKAIVERLKYLEDKYDLLPIDAKAVEVFNAR